MSFISVLDKIGHLGKIIWKGAEPTINAAAPEISLFIPAFGPIWGMTEALVRNAEQTAAAMGVDKAGKQKSAMVMSVLLPYLIQDAQKLGIVQPTSAQVQVLIDAVVNGLKAFAAL